MDELEERVGGEVKSDEEGAPGATAVYSIIVVSKAVDDINRRIAYRVIIPPTPEPIGAGDNRKWWMAELNATADTSTIRSGFPIRFPYLDFAMPVE